MAHNKIKTFVAHSTKDRVIRATLTMTRTSDKSRAIIKPMAKVKQTDIHIIP